MDHSSAADGADDGVELCLEDWPVVVVTAPAGTVSTDKLEAFLVRFDREVVQQKRPYACVLDLTNTGSMSPRQRKMMGERMRSDEAHQQLCVVGAFVFSSMLLRGMLTAIMWLRKPDYPMRIFATREEAVGWASSRMKEHAIGLPIDTEGTLDNEEASKRASLRPAPSVPPETDSRAVWVAPKIEGGLAVEAAPERAPRDVEERLSRLQRLHQAGMITELEYEMRRKEILAEL